MARTGMADLIQELRVMTQTGTADYQAGTVYYFTDDQLQAEIDKTLHLFRMAQLLPIGRQTGASSVIYQDYGIPEEVGYWVEGTVGGTTIWRVFNSAGQIIDATNYAVNLQQRLINFSANQLGSAAYLDCNSYNLHRAAANVWRWKAGNVGLAVDWSSDNMSVKSSQKRQQALDQARYYSSLCGIQMSYMVRSDEN